MELHQRPARKRGQTLVSPLWERQPQGQQVCFQLLLIKQRGSATFFGQAASNRAVVKRAPDRLSVCKLRWHFWAGRFPSD